MRLISFLNENAEELINKIKEECKPYILLLKQNNIKTPFLRGIKTAKENPFIVRQDRKSQGLPAPIARELNTWLEKNGYPRRDKSVICSSSVGLARAFGGVNFIFPIGEIKYAFVKSVDFNFDSSYKVDNLEEFISDRRDYFSAGIKSMPRKDPNPKGFLDKWGKKILINNKNIKEAYNNMFEIWFECEKYYAISKKSYENYVNKIKSLQHQNL
jgi:hypothetical protein